MQAPDGPTPGGDRVVVRAAQLGDDAALLELDRTGWTPGSALGSAPDDTRQQYFSPRRTPESHLVAQLGDTIVGYVAVLPKTDRPEGAHVYAIWGLVVSRSARRLGVGSALLAGAEQVAREHGARKLSLRVLGTNIGALALYGRHGFEVEGRHPEEFFIDGAYVDDLVLAKPLTTGDGTRR
jgi:ribosomal protein S18 acetylase RimI-like enzyme